jgi:hypothetical protein
MLSILQNAMHSKNLLEILLKFNVEYLQLEVFNYRHLKARLINIRESGE